MLQLNVLRETIVYQERQHSLVILITQAKIT